MSGFYIETQGGTIHMRHLAEDCIVYLMRKEMPRKRALYLDIEIKNLRKERVLGMVDNWKEGSRHFSTIELDNSREATVYDWIETLCHEFVHVKQYLRGDWKQAGNRIYWKGHDHTDTAYSKQPWEIEAFQEQKPLAKYLIKEKLHMTLKKAKETPIRKYNG